MELTLVTASMPKRLPLLRELLASVEAQTVQPFAHLVEVSATPLVPKLNRLIRQVRTPYFVQVDDDDVLYPEHVATLVGALTADVVWTWCDVEGRNWSPNEPYQPGVLRSRNYIPSNCALSTSRVLRLGGHRDVAAPDYHDWDMLRRLEVDGASFRNVPTVTWRYRFHGGNTGGRTQPECYRV